MNSKYLLLLISSTSTSCSTSKSMYNQLLETASVRKVANRRRKSKLPISKTSRKPLKCTLADLKREDSLMKQKILDAIYSKDKDEEEEQTQSPETDKNSLKKIKLQNEKYEYIALFAFCALSFLLVKSIYSPRKNVKE